MAGGLQDRALAARLHDAAPKLTRDLRDQFKQAGEKAARKTQAAILAAATHHDGGLQRQIAATVTVTGHVRAAGVSTEIRSTGRLMPPRKQNLPAYADAGLTRYSIWRHPVFPRPGTSSREQEWVTQVWPSARGWFTQTIHHEARAFGEAAQAAIDQVQAYLEGRGL